MRLRLVLPALAAALALLLAGCGGGSSGGPGAAATLAPAGAPVFVEATIRPEGEAKSDMEALARKVAGVDDLGALIVAEAEKATHGSGSPVDFEKDVEPWLGDTAGLYLEGYDGDEFHGYGVAIAVTDTQAAREFVAERRGDGTVAGVVGGFLVVAADQKAYRAMVAASGGESLADSERYAEAAAGVPADSVASVYVDIGGLVRQAGGAVDRDTRTVLEAAGIDVRQATALASLVPGSDHVEIDLSSDLGGEAPPSGDASKLLGELPASATAAIASPGFGARFGAAVDGIDADGIPGQIPPHQLKKTLKAAGIDLERIGTSVGSLGVFAIGSSRASLGGAAVLESKDAGEARNTVANVGLLLRASRTPGVTALTGRLSGFSVRSDDLGPRPLIVAAAGKRIVVAYGPRAAAAALAEGGATLSSDPTYREAVGALGETPISGFVDGPPALRLAADLIPADKRERFDQARPYLGKIDYVAIGAGAAGARTTAKLIVGVGG